MSGRERRTESMDLAARVYYDSERGWSRFPGYRTQRFRVNGELPSSLDAVLKAGIELTAESGSAVVDAALLRFDRYVVMHGRSSPVTLTWRRERTSAQTRGLVVLLRAGALRISSHQQSLTLGASEVVIVPPGTGAVVLRATEPVDLVFLSFDAEEVLPLRMRWHRSDGGVVRASIHALLEAAATAPQTSDPQAAAALRSLLRAAAKAILVQVTPVSDARDAETLDLVRLIIENRFQIAGFAVDDIVREVKLSRRVLERRLAGMGTTPAIMLRSRRVEQAQSLMRSEPGLTAREVALRSGFSSPSTMRRALLAAAANAPAEATSLER